MGSVATSTAIPASRLHGQHDRPSMVSVGTIVWLASELMFFAALFAAYFTIRNVSPTPAAVGAGDRQAQRPVRVGQHHRAGAQLGHLPARRLRRRARPGRALRQRLAVGSWGLREWFVLTYFMGSFFIAGQVIEYSELVTRERHDPVVAIRLDLLPRHRLPRPARDRRAHRVPLRLGRTFMAKTFTHEQAVTAIVVSYYWHFVDVVWIALFATIYLLK